jgi:hypothetical protein
MHDSILGNIEFGGLPEIAIRLRQTVGQRRL